MIEMRTTQVVMRIEDVDVPFDRHTGKSEYDGPYVNMTIRRDHLRALRRYKG
jgi:hypothetical protein